MTNLYINISVCYMKLKHFSLASKALQDADELDPKKVSLIYFRKSQVFTYFSLFINFKFLGFIIQ